MQVLGSRIFFCHFLAFFDTKNRKFVFRPINIKKIQARLLLVTAILPHFSHN